MVTKRFASLAGATAEAMATAYERVKGGEVSGTFPCPKCGSTVRFSGSPANPHRHAGSCSAPRCVRWATQ